MKVATRRKALIEFLLSEKNPVSGDKLAEKYGVSRQIIVQDISALKTSGYEIISTNRGYIVQGTPLSTRVFKVRHTSAQTEDELNLIVSLGGTVVDVFVWHKVYGKVEANLNIFSERSIAQFMDGIKSGKSKELMHITEGYHYHTVRADSEAPASNKYKCNLAVNYQCVDVTTNVNIFECCTM